MFKKILKILGIKRQNKNTLKAKVVSIKDESRNVKTFFLKPDKEWKGFVSGQYVSIKADIDGDSVWRCYSISSCPDEKDSFGITVKKIDGGRVSGWMHEKLNVGDTIELGQAAGDFVLGDVCGDKKLLFAMGGSGVTPGISILKDLNSKGSVQDIVFVQACKTFEDILFKAELDVFCQNNQHLKVIYFIENEDGFLTVDSLKKLVPDMSDRRSFMCGPAGMMDALSPAWQDFKDTLKTEVFVNSSTAKIKGKEKVSVKLKHSNKIIQARKGSILLEELEKSGVSHPFGCRMGACEMCVCVKEHGEVENVNNGEVSKEDNVKIKPCISIVKSDLKLDA